MFFYTDLVLAMGFAWMISGIVLLLLNKGNNRSSNRSGVILIFVFGLTLADNFLKPYMLTPFLVRFIYIFSRNSYFLIGPFLWFYSRSLLKPGKMEKLYFPLHLIPFILWSIYFLLTPRSQLPLLNPGSVRLPPAPMAGRIFSIAFFRDFSSILSRVIYSIIIVVSLIRHGKSVSQFYSRLTVRNTLSWLFYLILLYVILFLSNTLLFLGPFINPELRMSISTIVRILPSILFIFFFSLFARNQAVPEDRLPEKKENLPDRKKYSKSGLSPAESAELYELLSEHLKKTKIYLNPDLTLDELSKELHESRHRLSEVINRESSDSFYVFINSFRLREFLDSIDENRFPQYTILAIALECGFKSTSAFYSLFKKSMGKTPKEYIREKQLTAV